MISNKYQSRGYQALYKHTTPASKPERVTYEFKLYINTSISEESELGTDLACLNDTNSHAFHYVTFQIKLAGHNNEI